MKLASWTTCTGDECFCLECSKACDQRKWKNPHSCCLLNAQLHSRKNQPVQKPSPIFLSVVWPWVGWLLLVCGFHLQDYISIVMHMGAGVWSEEMAPRWHLLRNKKTAFPLYVRSLTGAGSSLLKATHVKCPCLCTGRASCILQSEINIVSLDQPNSFVLR